MTAEERRAMIDEAMGIADSKIRQEVDRHLMFHCLDLFYVVVCFSKKIGHISLK